MTRPTYIGHLLACRDAGETPLNFAMWRDWQKTWAAQRAQINATHKLEG